MKKIKTLLVSFLVVLTIALAINFSQQNQIKEYASINEVSDIETRPLPFSIKKPTQL
ncbi:MAG: hypothetical protein K0Q49_710 [Haloplasmataceae bacterium]|jgi:hypothetical protein|nr:hypothetical protein [Haloplasmataceae bacterium]